MSKPTNGAGAKYQVGYKKPPATHQFKKGQSGNPKGRPKGIPSLSELFLREASRMVTIKSGDQVREAPKREALVRRLIDMALQGDLAAARLALPHLFNAEAEAANANPLDAAPPPLSEAERAAMKILVDRLASQGGADG